jgi:hypothetical protein
LYACRFKELRSLAIDRYLEEAAMTRLTILSAAAVLSMMAATPVFAMPAIQEPGAFAFYHPNANVLNARASVPFGKSGAYTAHARLVRHVTPATPPSVGSGGRYGY